MAIEELSSRANDCYIGGHFVMKWMEAGDSSHQCAYIVEADASADEEVIVCSTDGFPWLVTALQADLDIDSSVTAGVMYNYYTLHAGTVLWVPHDTNADAAFGGEDMGRSETVAGMINAGPTIEDNELVGRLWETIDVAADKYCKLIS
jgi:hypothetical protein